MKIDTQDIKDMVQQSIAETDAFIVDIEVKPGKVSIFLDKPAGITIEECSKVHRHLKSEIDDEEFFERYDLEVSSPGMDRPLKVIEQYQRRLGSELNVKLQDDVKVSGVLKTVNENGITLEVQGQKETDKEEQIIDFVNIKEAKLLVNFGSRSKKKKVK
ncbi:MAG: ribosome maturation factor [Bacteroidia bacterium]|nr:ribosome maturation factor [Bacteroidia bacterium]